MNKEEQTGILSALSRGHQAFMAAVEGVTDDLAAKHAEHGRWSILECVEHVAVSEDFLLSRLLEAEYSIAPLMDRVREAAILARGADRTRPMISPDVVRPTARFSTLADAVGCFLASRDKTIGYVENCPADLRSMLTTHPLLGHVNGHEILLLMAVHPERHARQIDEIKAALAQQPSGRQ